MVGRAAHKDAPAHAQRMGSIILIRKPVQFAHNHTGLFVQGEQP